MSRGWKRFGEARLYIIGGSLGLLAMIWSALLVHDQQAAGDDSAAPGAGTSSASSSSGIPAAPRPHTTTRGS